MSTLLAVVGQFLLGGVLLTAGLAKLRDRAGFAVAVRGFGFVPQVWTPAVVATLPLVEATAGVMLLLGAAKEVAAAVSTVLLLGFTFGILVNLRRGRLAPCACFGASSRAALGYSAVARNLILLLAAAGVLSNSGRAESFWWTYLAGGLLASLGVLLWQLILAWGKVRGPARALVSRPS